MASPKHRLLTSNGFFQLDSKLMDCLQREGWWLGAPIGLMDLIQSPDASAVDKRQRSTSR